jgi:hypothetical protein
MTTDAGAAAAVATSSSLSLPSHDEFVKYRTWEEEEFHKQRMRKYPEFTMDIRDAFDYYHNPKNIIDGVALSMLASRFKTQNGTKRFIHSAKPDIDEEDRARQSDIVRTGNLNLLDRGRDWWVLINAENGLDHWCLNVVNMPDLMRKCKTSIPHHSLGEPILMELTLEKYKSLPCFAQMLRGREHDRTVWSNYRGLVPSRLLLHYQLKKTPCRSSYRRGS